MHLIGRVSSFVAVRGGLVMAMLATLAGGTAAAHDVVVFIFCPSKLLVCEPPGLLHFSAQALTWTRGLSVSVGGVGIHAQRENSFEVR